MDPSTGRFTTMDSYLGRIQDPTSLHKYLYAHSNPVNYTDPSGYTTLTEIMTAMGIKIPQGMNYSYQIILLHQKLGTTVVGRIVIEMGQEAIELSLEGEITLEGIGFSFVEVIIGATTNDETNLSQLNKKTKTYNVNGKVVNQKQFAALRSKAVREAWQEEKKLVKATGKGTRAWTPEEIKELMATGKVKGYEGQHMKSAATYPDFAGDKDNIQFLKGRKHDVNEHLDAHGGNYKNPTNGYYDPITEVMVDFGDYIPGR